MSSIDNVYAIWENINARNIEVASEAKTLAAELLRFHLEASDVAEELRRAREQCAEIERDLLLDGQIDGKNAEIRAAQLQRLLAQHDEHAALQERIRDREWRMRRLEAQIEYTRNMLSVAKLGLRWNVAVAQAWGGSDER